MKKNLLILTLSASMLCSGCATVFGGKVSECQRTKPAPGKPKRAIRSGALIADILLGGPIWTAVDFITGAIYKPCDK